MPQPINSSPPIDAAANIGSLRTLGYGSNQAISGPKVFGTVEFVSGGYSLSNSDRYIQIQTHGVTLTLPALSNYIDGEAIVFQDETGTISGFPVTITPDGSDDIDGSNSSYSFTTNNAVLVLRKTVTGWWTQIQGSLTSVSFGGPPPSVSGTTSATGSAGTVSHSDHTHFHGNLSGVDGSNNPLHSIPSFAIASLPVSPSGQYMSRLTDFNKGLTVYNGTQWTAVNSLTTFKFEDFGGVAGDSSGGARSANNAAWTAVMAAMGNDIAAKGHLTFQAGIYYFASEIHPTCQCVIEGIFAGQRHSATSLVFPPTSKGLVYDYYSATNPSGDAQTVQTINLRVSHDQTLATWQAGHSYATGAAVRPTYWTGYVFVNEGSTGTSAGSEPTNWTNNMWTPYTVTDGQTVTDNTVTWTAKLCPLISVQAMCQFENVVVEAGYGHGMQIFSDTTNSLADDVALTHIYAQNNLSGGIVISGSDSQIGSFTDIFCTGNGTWGIWASAGIGNNYTSLFSSYNGVAPVVKNITYSNIVDGYVTAPNDPSFSLTGCQNGYLYKTTVAGNTGGTLPLPGDWPTTVGTPIVIGAATFTCVSKWYGGDAYLGAEKVWGLYIEPGNLDAYIGGIVTGAVVTPSQDSPGALTVIGGNSTPERLINLKGSTDLTYDAVTRVGDTNRDLNAFGVEIYPKFKGFNFGSIVDQMLFSYNPNNGYYRFLTNTGSGYQPIQLPGLLATGRGTSGTGPVLLPNGLQTSTANSGPKMTTRDDPNVTASDVIGDLTWSSKPLYRSGMPSFYVSSTNGTGVWLESAWAAPISGTRIDVLSEFGETDLHLIVDDSVIETMGNLPSRRGGFTATVAGTVLATPAESILSTPGLSVFYDSSQRARKISYGGSLSGWFVLASNAAHVLPASGQRTIETVFYCHALTGTQTIMGYSHSGTSGYNLTVNSDGSIEFIALNTTPGNFIDLKSAASTVSTGTMNYAVVTFDSANDIYALWLNGTVVASASSHTGTLGTTADNVGLLGLITNGSTLSNGCPGIWVAEWERSTRAFSSSEIVFKSSQFRNSNHLSTTTDVNTYIFDNFGGIASDSSPTARAANNAAWETMMLAIGPLNVRKQSKVLFAKSEPYYFASHIRTKHVLNIMGVTGSSTLNITDAASFNGGTSLFFPGSDRGLVIDYDPTTTTGVGIGSSVSYLQVFHDQNLSEWQSSHVYASGAAIVPVGGSPQEFQPSTWTGYVFVNNGSSGTSGMSEPTWPENLTNPSVTEGQTISDGTVTWTAKLCPLIDVRATTYLNNVFASNAWGDGIRVYGNTTDSIADIGQFNNVCSWNNRSAGVFLFGNDANANLFTNLSSISNGTWGVLDKGFLSNRYVNTHLADNGASPWAALTAYLSDTLISPIVRNGYEYKVSSAGTTGASEPTWPTSIGATVVNGSVTFTNIRKWSGGPYSGASVHLGMYVEEGQTAAFNDQSGVIIGGSLQTFSSDSTGFVIKTVNDITPFTTPKISSDPVFDASLDVGDRNGILNWSVYNLLHKNNVAFDNITIEYNSNGYLSYRNGSTGTQALSIPFGNATLRGGANSPVFFGNGIALGGVSSNSLRLKQASSPSPASTDVTGDLVANSNPVIRSGMPSFYSVKNVSGSGVYREAGWTAPIEGSRIDVLTEFGSDTDLHLLVDDQVSLDSIQSQGWVYSYCNWWIYCSFYTRVFCRKSRKPCFL